MLSYCDSQICSQGRIFKHLRVAKEVLHILGQKLWHLLGSKVATPVHNSPVLQVVQAANPVLGHLGNLLGKDCHSRGYLPSMS